MKRRIPAAYTIKERKPDAMVVYMKVRVRDGYVVVSADPKFTTHGKGKEKVIAEVVLPDEPSFRVIYEMLRSIEAAYEASGEVSHPGRALSWLIESAVARGYEWGRDPRNDEFEILD